jgi:hypothetical protein
VRGLGKTLVSLPKTLSHNQEKKEGRFGSGYIGTCTNREGPARKMAGPAGGWAPLESFQVTNLSVSEYEVVLLQGSPFKASKGRPFAFPRNGHPRFDSAARGRSPLGGFCVETGGLELGHAKGEK